VDPRRLTVVVTDEQDRSMLLRTFEEMVGLTSGALVPEPGRHNRSLTYGEVELHRRLNIAFAEQGWGEVEYAKLIRHGMVANLQQTYKPAMDVARLQTPHWALERASAAGAATVATIERLGVNVVGDLDSLAKAPPTTMGEDSPPVSLPMRAITQAVVGVVIGSRTTAPIEVYQHAVAHPGLRRRVRRRLNRWKQRLSGSAGSASARG
jgi:hypothetical protein